LRERFLGSNNQGSRKQGQTSTDQANADIVCLIGDDASRLRSGRVFFG